MKNFALTFAFAAALAPSAASAAETAVVKDKSGDPLAASPGPGRGRDGPAGPGRAAPAGADAGLRPVGAACRDYIRRLRLPQGFTCPCCGEAGEPWVMTGGWLRCRACRTQTSLTAGTIFEGTRKPLRMWFPAMWLVTSRSHMSRQTPACLRPRRCRARGDGSHRRLEGSCRTGGGRLPASGTGPQRRLRPGARSHATRPPRRLAPQAMADPHSPGWRPASTSRLPPRRFNFRFNRRRSKARGLLFHRLAQQAPAVGPAPYNAIAKPADPSDPFSAKRSGLALKRSRT